MEWRNPSSDVHTFKFHEHRERAAHLEQAGHRHRLEAAFALVKMASEGLPETRVSDLGCGDGGLLQLVKERMPNAQAWGYDFHPASEAGWVERGVTAYSADVFNDSIFPQRLELGNIVVMTEVLEHLRDPYDVLRKLRNEKYGDETAVTYIVASSPRHETAESHDACHQWVWDWVGYEALFIACGWKVERHMASDWSQLILAS